MSAFFDMLYAYRNVVYVRVKTDWLSVRIVRDGKRIGEYEDVPQIAIRQRKAFLYNVVAIGRDAAQAVRESGDVSLCSGFNHPRVVLGNFEDTQNVLEQFVLRAFGGKRTLLAYRMLIHPFPPMEGGLSDLEERGLMELGRQIGAREVVACQHPQELSDNDLTDFSQWRLPLGERMIQRRIAR